MPDVNQNVLALVRREIEKNPSVSNDVLVEIAAAIDRSVRKLSRQQFHGTYRLTAARAIASARGGRRKAAGGQPASAKVKTNRPGRRTHITSAPNLNTDPSGRTAVRAALLEFASEIAKAESKADIIDALSSIERYVERVLAAAVREQVRS
jgi:hypothetical protein